VTALSRALPTTLPARLLAAPEIALPAALVALGFVGHFAVPSTLPVLRAVLVAPAVLWVPGRCVLSRSGIPASAGKWTTPLAVLFSIVIVIVASLIAYEAAGHVPLGTLPLWVSLAALPLCHWHAVPPSTGARNPARTLGFVAVFTAGALAVAGIVALANHLLPAQQQPGYLAFSFGGSYADVPGVVRVKAGSVLDVPVSVTASKQDLAGLTVAISLDGHPVPGAAAIPVSVAGSGQGYAQIKLTVPKTCLSRYSFTLGRPAASLRLLDLYVTTDGMAACGGK
jgi:hypothetical protein